MNTGRGILAAPIRVSLDWSHRYLEETLEREGYRGKLDKGSPENAPRLRFNDNSKVVPVDDEGTRLNVSAVAPAETEQ